MPASLFDPDESNLETVSAEGSRERPQDSVDGVVVRVLADETGLDKTFDYLVPPKWRDQVAPGTRVRIALGPRRVGAWVVEVGVVPPDDVALKPIAKVSGHGPAPDLIDLADWARWRWAAKTPVPFLRTASPPRNVAALPARRLRPNPVPAAPDEIQRAFAVTDRPAVLRLPPDDDLYGVVQAAAHLGDTLFICASHTQARRIEARLRRARVPVAAHADDWAAAAAGGVSVVGTRAAAWAPIAELAAVVVFDEHDEVHQEEASPTWHARDVAVERARRAGVPCVMTSPLPTLEALGAAELFTVGRSTERAGWPAIIVADRRDDDAARNALFSPAFVDAVRSGARIVCVLNQKGRAVLLACKTCGELARCEACDHAVRRPDDVLVCGRCGTERPVVCAACGGVNVRTVRMGVTRVADDLAALAGEDVTSITGDTPRSEVTAARLAVGTEAALHRVDAADVVAFLDFDQELYAARYRAAEQALALIARAGRLVGGRREGGRVLVQTRAPDHEVIRAALAGDPTIVSDVEAERRVAYGLPPAVAVAEVAGAGAPDFVAAIDPASGLTIQGPRDDRWRLVAPDHRTLCDGLAAVPRPSGRLRLAVDPLRL